MRAVSRPRVPGSGPGKRRRQQTHWQAMLAQGDALAAAVEDEHNNLNYCLGRIVPTGRCNRAACVAARAWREARGPA